MVNDLISRSALLEEWKKKLSRMSKDRDGAAPIDFQLVLNALENAPAVDAVEVVRCKDCEYRGSDMYCPMCYEEVYEIDEGDGYYDTEYILHDRTHNAGFCDLGKRRADDDEGI